MICITLSVHVLSDFFRISSDFIHPVKQHAPFLSLVSHGESCWWVMCFPLSLHIAWHGWNNNTSTTGEKNLKDIVRTCQNSLTLCNWAHFFSHPSWDPIFNRFCCASSAHLRFSTITFLSSYASAFSVFSRSSARAWRSRIVRPDMTGLITRRKDEDHQGLVQHLKRFKGRETKRW